MYIIRNKKKYLDQKFKIIIKNNFVSPAFDKNMDCLYFKFQFIH